MNLSDKSHLIKQGSEESAETKNSHPDINRLSSLLSSEHSHSSNINRDNSSLKLHVAECLQCQKLLTVLTALNQSRHIIKNTTISEGQQMLIVDYVNRGFSISRKKLLRQKIQDEPSSLKALLHYASHNEAMRLNIKPDITTQGSSHGDDSEVKKTEAGFNLLSIFSRLLMKFQLPFKAPFKWSFSFNFSTVYTIFVSLVSISLLFIVLSDKLKPVDINETETSVRLADDNRSKIEFISNGLNGSNVIYALKLNKEAPDTANVLDKRQEAGKVTINLSKKQALHIAWPVSAKKNRYTLSFYALSEPIQKPVLSLTTTGNFVDLDVNNFESGKPYRWIFSYQASTEKMFRAQGGFVIKPFNSKH